MTYTAAQYHRALKGVIKRAIIVLDALGDSEMRFLALGRALNEFENVSRWDALDRSVIAFNQPNYVKVVPTSREIAQAEVVEGWLVWLAKQEGRQAVPRLVAWAHDDPLWRIGDRESPRCSARVVGYRIDKSVAAILKEFGLLDAEIQEPLPESSLIGTVFRSERPTANDNGGRADIKKVYIAGIGFMRNGHKVNDGREKFAACVQHAS